MQDGAAAQIEQATGAVLLISDYGQEDMYELAVSAGKGPALREAMRCVLEEMDRVSGARNGSFRLKLLVPRWLASMIIGFRGMNVKELCRSTNTQVHIGKDAPGDGEPCEQVACVVGLPSRVLDVLRRILQFRQDRHEARIEPIQNAPWNREVRAKEEISASRHSRGPCLDEREPSVEPQRQPPTPPPPWTLEEHPEAPGEWYYLNTDTGETTWELPGEEEQEEVEEEEAESDAGGRPPTPPPPWQTVEHPEAPGEWYYLNEETGETCWELSPEA